MKNFLAVLAPLCIVGIVSCGNNDDLKKLHKMQENFKELAAICYAETQSLMYLQKEGKKSNEELFIMKRDVIKKCEKVKNLQLEYLDLQEKIATK